MWFEAKGAWTVDHEANTATIELVAHPGYAPEDEDAPAPERFVAELRIRRA